MQAAICGQSSSQQSLASGSPDIDEAAVVAVPWQAGRLVSSSADGAARAGGAAATASACSISSSAIGTDHQDRERRIMVHRQ